MNYIEGISLLKSELKTAGYSKKELKDMELLYQLSKAQKFIGNKHRLLVKQADVYLSAGVYIYEKDSEAGDYPQDVLSVDSCMIYGTDSLSSLDERPVQEVISEAHSGNKDITKYSYDTKALYINAKPQNSYHATNFPNEKIKIIYYHNFLLFTGDDNYEWTITDELDEEFSMPEEYMDMVIALAVGFIMPERYIQAVSQVETSIAAMDTTVRSSTLSYHFGV